MYASPLASCLLFLTWLQGRELGGGSAGGRDSARCFPNAQRDDDAEHHADHDCRDGYLHRHNRQAAWRDDDWDTLQVQQVCGARGW